MLTYIIIGGFSSCNVFQKQTSAGHLIDTTELAVKLLRCDSPIFLTLLDTVLNESCDSKADKINQFYTISNFIGKPNQLIIENKINYNVFDYIKKSDGLFEYDDYVFIVEKGVMENNIISNHYFIYLDSVKMFKTYFGTEIRLIPESTFLVGFQDSSIQIIKKIICYTPFHY